MIDWALIGFVIVAVVLGGAALIVVCAGAIPPTWKDQ